MSELWLQETRTVLAVPGAGFHYGFGPQEVDAVRRLFKRGLLRSDNTFYDAVGGNLLGLPDETLTAMVSGDWVTTGSAWRDASVESRSADGTQAAWPAALQFTGTGEWTLSTSATRAWGERFWLQLITYTGTQAPITLYFGGVWRVRLFDTGQADLFEQVPVYDGDGEQTGWAFEPRRQFDWMTAERFAPAIHRLWCYEVRGKLIVRAWYPGVENRQVGLVYDDLGAQAEPDADPPEGEAEPLRHALRDGVWAAEGAGPITLAWCPQKFIVGTSTLELPTAAELVKASSEPVTVTLHGAGDVVPGESGAADTMVAPTVTVYDQAGGEWPQSGTVTPARSGLRWTMTWETTTDRTYYLAGLSLKVPRTTASDGNSGTDLAAVSGVSLQGVSLVREGDLTRERLSARAFGWKTDLASWCQSNMAVRYVVGGVTRFRGLTSNARWGDVVDTVPQTGTLSLDADGLWRMFRKQHWPGGPAFDGRLLTECLAEVVEAAGLTAAEYELAETGYAFPAPPDGEPPALVFRPGTTLDQILEDLRRKFYGSRLVHYFRTSDGKFVLAELAATGTSSASFFATSAAAKAAGAVGQEILSYETTLDDSELYNLVAVIGQRSDGEPLLARAIDWGSISDPDAFNYVDGVWPLIVADPGLQTQAAVNWVCRSLYERHRWPRVHAQWRSGRLDLFPGEFVTLVGANYGVGGTLCQLRGVSIEESTQGDAADPLGRATYSAEVVR